MYFIQLFSSLFYLNPSCLITSKKLLFIRTNFENLIEGSVLFQNLIGVKCLLKENFKKLAFLYACLWFSILFIVAYGLVVQLNIAV